MNRLMVIHDRQKETARETERGREEEGDRQREIESVCELRVRGLVNDI